MKGDLMRKAQRDYRKQTGDPRKDAIKQAYYDEQIRREQDFDRALKEAKLALAVIATPVKENNGQGPP